MFEVVVEKGGDTCDTAENKCVAGVMPLNGGLYFDVCKCGNQTIRFDENGQAFSEIQHGDIYEFGIESAVLVLRDLAKTNPKFTVRIKSQPNNAETVLIKFIDIDKDGEDSDEW